MVRSDTLSNTTATAKDQQREDILRKIFLGGLPPNMTEDSLRCFYNQFGEILDIVIMRDLATNRSRGFGFVTYQDASSVDRAQAARPHVIDGRSIDSKRVLARSNTTKSSVSTSGRKVFVGGLKDVHNEDALREYFQQFGSVMNVKVLVDKNTGRKRGFAYVEFDDYDSADKAVIHKNHTIKYLTVDVKKSNYKEEQAKKMANQIQSDAPSTVGPPQAAPYAYPPGPYPPQYGYPPVPAYGGWGAPPAPYPQQPPAYGAPPPWNAWGYGVPPTGAPPVSALPVSAPPASVPSASNGNYHQSYNGGPQKVGKLQNYRNNPYKA